MSLLTPLGLLGLIGIIVLIIIYIIKPNYQSKFISSTFIWKMSLKYKKKRIPLSKLRNILLFICQVLIITAAAFILSQPFLNMENDNDGGDVILIIDASASMHSQINEQTRLERAADRALADATEALNKGKKVTVILASDTASFLVQQAPKEQDTLVYNAFDTITSSPESLYTYGTPDIDGAMQLAEQITSYTDNVSVTLYTDTTYLYGGEVNVYNVNDVAEWNAAILDVRATLVEGNQRIEIDVASYGADSRLTVECEIFNYNETGLTMEIEKDVYCSGDEIVTIVLGYVSEDMEPEEAELIDENIDVTTYEHIYVHISEYDSLDYDNRFYLYGGQKPTIEVGYYSTQYNTFWETAFEVLADALRDKLTIDFERMPETDSEGNAIKPATEGYDIYIYEHYSPAMVPSDGVVIYSDPSQLPSAAGIRFGSQLQLDISTDDLDNLPGLSPGESHAIMNNVDVTKICVSMFTSITSYDGYTPVAYIEDYPLIMVKEDVDQKIVLMPFSLHFSELAVLPEFPVMLYNIINYFFPLTIDEYVYEINDILSVSAKAAELGISGPGTELTLETFPAEVVVKAPGTYTMTQTPISGNTVIENIYVKIPATESNINLTEDALTNPYFYTEADSNATDLLFYFALALVALLFLEWWLKSREQI